MRMKILFGVGLLALSYSVPAAADYYSPSLPDFQPKAAQSHEFSDIQKGDMPTGPRPSAAAVNSQPAQPPSDEVFVSQKNNRHNR